MEQIEEIEGYFIDVEEAAKILGVSRTRLSQLTSRGALSYQRRKIGTRNRLFYKRDEILRHLQRSMGASALPPEEPQIPLRYVREEVTEDLLKNQANAKKESFTAFQHRRITKSSQHPLASELARAEAQSLSLQHLENLIVQLKDKIALLENNQNELRLDQQELKRLSEKKRARNTAPLSEAVTTRLLDSSEKKTPRRKYRRCALRAQIQRSYHF